MKNNGGVVDFVPTTMEKYTKKHGGKKKKRNKGSAKVIHATLDVNQLVRDVFAYVDKNVHERISAFNVNAGGRIVAEYDPRALDNATTDNAED